jgi:GAF domain-containing protein
MADKDLEQQLESLFSDLSELGQDDGPVDAKSQDSVLSPLPEVPRATEAPDRETQASRGLRAGALEEIEGGEQPGRFLDSGLENTPERRQTQAALARRVAELETAAKVRAAASSILDQHELLQTVVDLTQTNFDLYQAHIYLLNSDTGTLDLSASSGEVGRQLVAEGWRISIEDRKSIVARTARGRQGVIVNNVHNATGFLSNPLLPDTHSELAVPLVVGEKLLGVLDVQADEVDRFSDEDVRIQTTLAAQVAIALENARLFEAERKARLDAAQQSLRLVLLNELGTDLSHASNIDQIFEIVSAKSKLIVGGDWASITLLTDSGDRLQVFALDGDQGAVPTGTYLAIDAHSETGRAIRERQVIVTNESQHSDPPQNRILATAGPRSTIVAPLVTSNRVLGTLNLGSKKGGAYGKVEVGLIQQIAAFLATTLQSRWLFEQTERALQETQALYRTGQALARMDDEREMFSLVLAEYLQNLGLKQGGVLLFDDRQLSCTLEAHMVAGQWVEPGLQIPVADNPIIERLIARKETVAINDVATDPVLGPYRDFSLGLGIKSMLLVPIIVRGKVIGGLGADATGARHEFTHREISLVQAMADQLSIALENHRLLAETEKLHQAGRRISEAGDLQGVVTAVAEAIAVPSLNRVTIQLFVYNMTGELEATELVAAWHNEQGPAPDPVGTRYPRQALSLLKALLVPEPSFLEDIGQDVLLSPPAREMFLRVNLLALGVLPLWVGTRQIGVLAIGYQEPHQFAERDIQTYVALSRLVAPVVANRQLLDETRTALAEVEATQRRYTVQAWESYRKIQQSLYYDQVRDQATPADKPPSSEIHDGASQPGSGRLEPRTGTSSAGRQGGEKDGQLEPSKFVLPLTVRGAIIGHLGMESPHDREWSSEELAFLEAIGEQLSQAVENLRLLDEAQRRAAREVRINEINEKIQGTQSLEEALQVAVKEVGLALQAPQSTVQLVIDPEAAVDEP